jgi:hypothetical protein
MMMMECFYYFVVVDNVDVVAHDAADDVVLVNYLKLSQLDLYSLKVFVKLMLYINDLIYNNL